jgi:hypothetical protein
MASFTEIMFGTAGDAASDARKRQSGIDTSYESGVEGALTPYRELAGQVDTAGLYKKYVDKLSGTDTEQYKVKAPTLSTEGALSGVSKYLDPSLDYQMGEATKAIEGSAAGRGGLFSGATGLDIAGATRKIGEAGWSDAYNRNLAEINRQNEIKKGQFGLDTSGGTFNLGMDTAGTQALELASEAGMAPLNTLTQAQIDMLNTRYGAQSGASQQQLGADLANTGLFSDILGFGKDIGKSYLGGM